MKIFITMLLMITSCIFGCREHSPRKILAISPKEQTGYNEESWTKTAKRGKYVIKYYYHKSDGITYLDKSEVIGYTFR